jgi:hypothetical protein
LHWLSVVHALQELVAWLQIGAGLLHAVSLKQATHKPEAVSHLGVAAARAEHWASAVQGPHALGLPLQMGMPAAQSALAEH